MGNKHWSQSDITFLEDSWGHLTMPFMSSRLGRSPASVRKKAWELGLGKALECGDYVTLRSLIDAVAPGKYSTRKRACWLSAGLPARKKRIDRGTFYVVNIDEFWKWAESHRSLIDWSACPPLALGKEPDWVQEQRLIDGKDRAVQSRGRRWTSAEDSRLKMLLEQNRYSYADLAEIFGRTAASISRRISVLGLIRLPERARRSEWPAERLNNAKDIMAAGGSYTVAAKATGCSEQALRSRMAMAYGTSSTDMVRKKILEEKHGVQL